MSKGIVYLIGAGPGDPGLITVKGLEYLRHADVVIYDYLVSPELLEECSSQAEKIYVGKFAGCHCVPQPEINMLTVAKALEGKKVARLKGGDPYIFGRGGEEAQCLCQAGIPFEIIPGVTASFAAAAYSGIPLTHRDFASSVGLITGHESSDKKLSRIEWQKMAGGMDTLAFYMGVTNLPFIAEQLMEHGRPATTPVAVIRWGTTTRQETLIATLDTVVAHVREAGLKPPAIIIVGEVVGLRNELRWFDNRPLFGKRIALAEVEISDNLIQLLQKQGAQVLPCSFVEIKPKQDWTEMDNAIANLHNLDILILSSSSALKCLLARLKVAGSDLRALHGIKIVAANQETALCIETLGICPDLAAGEGSVEEIADLLVSQGVAGKRILYLGRVDIDDTIQQKLSTAGARMIMPLLYSSRIPTDGGTKICQVLSAREVDTVLFTSRTAVKVFMDIVGSEASKLLHDVVLVSNTPHVSDALKCYGLTANIKTTSRNAESIIKSMEQFYLEGVRSSDISC